MNDDTTRLLQQYVVACNCADLDAIGHLLDASCLLETPFLRPNRLVGRDELMQAHAAIFADLDAIEIRLDRVLADAGHAIAEGSVTVTRDGFAAPPQALGIAIEPGDSGLRRISLYGDARNLRPWSDRRIL